MDDCLFCKIIDGEIPSNKVYEDDKVLCFHDVDPQAPVHCLLVPKKHIPSIDEVQGEDAELLSYMMLKIKDIAAELGLENVEIARDFGTVTVKRESVYQLLRNLLDPNKFNTEFCDICSENWFETNEDTVVLFKFVPYSVPTMTTEPYWKVIFTYEDEDKQ